MYTEMLLETIKTIYTALLIQFAVKWYAGHK